MGNNGLERIESPYSVAETADKFEEVLAKNKVKLFNKINHSENISKVDLELRETILFIFGAPKVGGLLMQDNQEVAIDLPMKLLIWENEEGQTMLTRNVISWLEDRHQLTEDEGPAKLEMKVNAMIQETIA